MSSPSIQLDEDEDEIFDADFTADENKVEGKATLLSSSLNMANSAIGAGVLSFPFAFLKAGLIFGIIITIVQTLISELTLHWVGRESVRHPPSIGNSYERMVKESLGTIPSVILILCLIGNVLGAMIAYLIIIGDMIVPILQNYFGVHFYTNRAFVTIFFLAIILAISSMRSMDSLSITSTFSLISISVVVLYVIVSSILSMARGETSGKIHYYQISWGIFQAIPIMTFALTCHAQAPPIFQELKNNSEKRIFIVGTTCFSLCFALYLSTGLFGYLEFRGDTADNILNNFPNGSIAANISRICVTITVSLSYPLMNFVFRSAFDYIVFNVGYKAIFRPPPPNAVGASWGIQNMIPIDITTPFHARYVVITIIAGFVCWIISILVPSIAIVFSLIGSVAGSLIVFIYPALLEMKHAKTLPAKALTIVILVYGIIIAILGTIVSLFDIFFS